MGIQLLHRLRDCREGLLRQTRFLEQVSMCVPKVPDPHKHFVTTRLNSVRKKKMTAAQVRERLRPLGGMTGRIWRR